MELTGPEGAHYHFWIPKGTGQMMQSLRNRAVTAARSIGDPVSFSYDILPERKRDE